MKVVAFNTEEPEVLPVQAENIIHLPFGLLGFEAIKRYVLLSNPNEAPFHWLQVVDDPKLAFLVLSPFEVVPDYAPIVAEADLDSLGITDLQSALIYNIVRMNDKGGATLNLKGPIIVNPKTLEGKQVIPVNASQLAVRHPIPAAT